MEILLIKHENNTIRTTLETTLFAYKWCMLSWLELIVVPVVMYSFFTKTFYINW